MDSVHETFFEEVKSGNYDTVLPCNEIAVFGIDTDKCKEYKVAPMSCDTFCIIIVTDGTAKLSVNYSVEELRKNSMAFLMPNMVMSLSNADKGFKMKGVCFTPAYFDDLSSYAPVYN